MRERYQANLEYFGRTSPSGDLSQGFFGEAGTDGLRMYRVDLRYESPPSVPRAGILIRIRGFKSGDLPLDAFGDDDPIPLVREFLVNQTARAKERNSVFRSRFSQTSRDYEARRIQSAIEAAIIWMPNGSIGGDVDPMILEPGSAIRWIDRKTECSQSQSKQTERRE